MRIIKYLLLMLALPVLAQPLTIKKNAPQTYVVKPGDTLWDISALYLEQPWNWPQLWRNNTQIINPHLIYPGDRLVLVKNAQGQVRLELSRADKPRVKLSPATRIKTKHASQAIAVLPWSVIKPYIENDVIMDEQQYQALPHLLGNYKGYFRFADQEFVLGQSGAEDEKFTVLRQQGEVRNMQGDVLGIQARHVAYAEPLATELQQQLLVKIDGVNFEARRGDRLYPSKEVAQQDLQLLPATQQRGFIIDSLEQHRLLGKYDVVVLDLGDSQVKGGMVMGIYVQGPDISGGDEPKYAGEKGFYQDSLTEELVQQPGIKVGELVVFKVFAKTSYALIIRSSDIIRRGSIVASP